MINLQKKLTRLKNIKILFLCGNHDEFFYKLINAENIIKIEEKELDLKKPSAGLTFCKWKKYSCLWTKKMDEYWRRVNYN